MKPWYLKDLTPRYTVLKKEFHTIGVNAKWHPAPGQAIHVISAITILLLSLSLSTFAYFWAD